MSTFSESIDHHLVNFTGLMNIQAGIGDSDTLMSISRAVIIALTLATLYLAWRLLRRTPIPKRKGGLSATQIPYFTREEIETVISTSFISTLILSH